MKKYNIIYADPPWDSNSQFGRDKKKGNDQHYPLMTIEDIKNLPVGELADDSCVLLLWAVDTQLRRGDLPTKQSASPGPKKPSTAKTTLVLGCGRGKTRRCACLRLKGTQRGRGAGCDSCNGIRCVNIAASQTRYGMPLLNCAGTFHG